jgi:hypothetical protein
MLRVPASLSWLRLSTPYSYFVTDGPAARRSTARLSLLYDYWKKLVAI